MNGKRARLLRAEANTRYDDGERHYDDQLRQGFYHRLKKHWTRTHKVA